MANAGLGEFRAGCGETVPRIKGLRVGTRVERDALATRAARKVDQSRQDRAADPTPAPRTFHREAPDAAVGQQPATADRRALFVGGHDMTPLRATTTPLNRFPPRS